MERITRRRAAMLLLFVVAILSFFCFRLYSMQVTDSGYQAGNVTTYTTRTRVRAARGDIVDTKGNVLVTNRVSYDLVFNHYVILSSGNPNERLLELALKCRDLGIEYYEHFPVTKQWPFEYTLQEYSTTWQGYFQAFLVNRGNLDSDITAQLLMQQLRKSYEIPEDWSDEDARLVIGLRYELTLRNGVTNLPNYIFLEDVSEFELAAILELNLPGLNVESSSVRVYNTAYAAHILGYIGAMNAEQWKIYKDQGYAMDALVGQSGFELAFESYLHSTDGVRVDVVTGDGTVVDSWYEVEPKGGNNVEVSIDLMMQMAAEDKLAEIIEYYRSEESTSKTGHDAEGGAVVAIDVQTGQILVCGSYPSYDPSRLFIDYNEIANADYTPLLNRALMAAYPPGSVYKPTMAIAGIQSGTIKPTDKISTSGVYSKYGFRASCWQYNDYGYGHGQVDAIKALRESCNYYFYVVAERMGNMTYIDQVAKGVGLGEPTGVELYELMGHRANPQTKAELFAGTDSDGWYFADQIMAGIGQSYNRFTPMQLASYAMALANQGTRYKATFLDRVISADYRELVYENKTQVLSTYSISNLAYQTYLQGMKEVASVSSGTAYGTFKNYPITVAAKTGTAEDNPNASSNGAFICFAPADNPRIAVVVYGEKIGGGSRLAPVAREILDLFFGISTGQVETPENQPG